MSYYGSEVEIDDDAWIWARASAIASGLADLIRDIDANGYELSCVLFQTANWLDQFSVECRQEAESAGFRDYFDVEDGDVTLEALAALVGVAGGKSFEKEIAKIHEIAEALIQATSPMQEAA